MAMNGSFAGGLADGLRNGMAIAQAYDVSKDRAREREEADRQKRVNRRLPRRWEEPATNCRHLRGWSRCRDRRRWLLGTRWEAGQACSLSLPALR